MEESNLNRQNYTEADLGLPKVEALKKRLLDINPNAKISAINAFINHDNVGDIVSGHDVAINALDFKSDIPFVFDKLCAEQGIYETIAQCTAQSFLYLSRCFLRV